MEKKLIIGVSVVFLTLGIFCLYTQLMRNNFVVTSKTQMMGVINPVSFICGEHKTIQAIFFEDKVELTLSDTRNMLLEHAISASGARYANSDESFIFWNKGNTAFVEEKGTTTFKDCVESSDVKNRESGTQ